MKKVVLLAFSVLLLLPSAALAYSFQTEESSSLTEFVDTLQDERYEPVAEAERASKTNELAALLASAKNSFLSVRNAEIARLNQVFSTRSQALRDRAQAAKERDLLAINRACNRRKQGKNAKQQAAIEAACKKRRQASVDSWNRWLQRQINSLQKNWGANSIRRTSLEDNYTRALENADRSAVRGAGYIASRPLGVAPTLQGSISAPTGTKKVGSTLIAQRGTWSGTPTPEWSYVWQRCETSAADCAPIDGATEYTYTLVEADTGKFIRVGISASNGFLPNAGPFYSALTSEILSGN